PGPGVGELVDGRVGVVRRGDVGLAVGRRPAVRLRRRQRADGQVRHAVGHAPAHDPPGRRADRHLRLTREAAMRHALRGSGAAALALAVAAAVGCGGDKPKLVPVTGKVTYKNEPVTAGTITFHPDPTNA